MKHFKKALQNSKCLSLPQALRNFIPLLISLNKKTIQKKTQKETGKKMVR
jgi:hypothetical protein